jgi:RNA polymerase II subunit A small phosphatase-like protein
MSNIESLVTQVSPDTSIPLQQTNGQPAPIKNDFAQPVLTKDEDDNDEAANEEKGSDEKQSCWSFLCCFGRPKPKPVKQDKEKDTTPPAYTPSFSSTNSNSQADSTASTKVDNETKNEYVPKNQHSIPPPRALLAPLPDNERPKKTLVLDLDETLVHSSFKPIPNADFVISIELESVIHRVYVLKRPGVDNFLRVVGAKFEVVVFTASLAKYADPLLDILDKNRVVKARLFREACVHHYGNYVKDLSHLGRRLENTIIIDNSPFSYMFQPDNAIPITSWFNDKNDRQLYDLLPFLDSMLNVDDVSTVLHRRKPLQITQTNNMQNMA